MANMKYIKFSIPAVLITNTSTFNFKKTQYNKLCTTLFMDTNWQSVNKQKELTTAHRTASLYIVITYWIL